MWRDSIRQWSAGHHRSPCSQRLKRRGCKKKKKKRVGVDVRLGKLSRLVTSKGGKWTMGVRDWDILHFTSSDPINMQSVLFLLLTCVFFYPSFHINNRNIIIIQIFGWKMSFFIQTVSCWWRNSCFPVIFGHFNSSYYHFWATDSHCKQPEGLQLCLYFYFVQEWFIWWWFICVQASKVLPNMKGLQGGTLLLAHGTADGTNINFLQSLQYTTQAVIF